MVGKLLAPEIKSMIDARNFGALHELFSDWPPADVAPFAATLVDVTGLIIYFSIALLIMRGAML